MGDGIKRLYVAMFSSAGEFKVKPFSGNESWADVMPDQYGAHIVFVVATSQEAVEAAAASSGGRGLSIRNLARWPRTLVAKGRKAGDIDFDAPQPAPEVLILNED